MIQFETSKNPRLVRNLVWALVAFVCLSPCLFIAWLFNDMIGVEDVGHFVSPDRHYEVVLLQVDAGATTPYSIHAVLVPVGVKPNFRTAFLTIDHYGDLPQIRWVNNQRIEVGMPECRVYQQEPRATARRMLFWSRTVKIDYFASSTPKPKT